MKKPTCAVLLAAFNGEIWIKQQIDSILKQKLVEVVIFVSVDLSDDSTFSTMKKIAENENRVNILPYGKKFGSAGKNFFRLIQEVDTSDFDIIAFSDQDDIWFENKLANAWSKLNLNICNVYSSNVISFWENGRRKIVKKSFPQKKFDYFFESAGPGCTFVFSSETYENIKVFICKNYESLKEVSQHDWLIYAYCRHKNFIWFIDEMPQMLYRQHSQNEFGANNNVNAYLKRILYVKNNWYKEQIIEISNLILGYPEKKLIKKSFLLKNIFQIRRRPRDQLAFLFFIILGLF